MTAPAAIRATYSDLRFVKSRKVAQITLEIPIEEAPNAVALFGTPNPAEETWVALARIQAPIRNGIEGHQPEAGHAGRSLPITEQAPPKERRRFSELPPSQQAALKCQDADFRIWLTQSGRTVARNADDAAEFIRLLCGVDSRSDLNTNPAAAAIWQETLRDFNVWRDM